MPVRRLARKSVLTGLAVVVCGSTSSVVRPAAAVTAPSGREAVAMAYDALRQKVVLFGGNAEFSDRGGELNDTWLWNGTAWKQKTPATSPPAREHAMMAFDAVSGKVVLFGGIGETCGTFTDASCVKLNDTWTWDGSNWAPVATPVSPSPRSAGAMAYDKRSGKIVLFGGEATTSVVLDDTWTWDGSTGAWTLETPENSPPGRQRAVMAFDGLGLVLFGGEPTFGASGTDTWTWDGATSNWTEQSPSTVPPFRDGSDMAYDGARKRAVMFSGGGLCCTQLTDTWTWNGTTRTWALASETGPEARFNAGMAYDAARQRVVLFGGSTPRSGIENDTWTWNGTAWKLRA